MNVAIAVQPLESFRSATLSQVNAMRILLVVSLIAVAIPNAAVVHAQGSGSMTAHDHGMPMPQDGAMTALLTNPFGSRGASGTATVSGTSVRMQWSGDQPGTVRVWSVRRGSCARDDGLVGVASAYAPMAVDASGSALGSASLAVPLAADSQFYVLVQTTTGSAATSATATPLACGVFGKGATPTLAAAELATSPNGSGPAAGDQSAMDHSTMDMSGMNMSDRGGTDASLMEIHMRMMADPVIRERVMTDPVLQRMMSGMEAMGVNMPGMTNQPAGTGAGGNVGAASTAIRPAAKAAARPARRPATTPVTKPTAKPAPAATPGMDHSKMPGMRKPPV